MIGWDRTRGRSGSWPRQRGQLREHVQDQEAVGSRGRLGRHQPGACARTSGHQLHQPVDQADPARQLLQGNRHARPVPADRILGQLGAGPVRTTGSRWRGRSPAAKCKQRAHPGPPGPPPAGRRRPERPGRLRPRRRQRRRTAAWRACGADTIGERRVHLVGRARPVADLRRLRHRHHQRAGLQRCRAHGEDRAAAVLAALPQGRDRPGQDPPAARDRPFLPAGPPARAHLLLQRRALHGRVRLGAEARTR